MPKFIIERDIPGVGQWKPAELHDIAQRSCTELTAMGPTIQWVESFVTPDRIYCVYIAPSEGVVREHAARGGFPVDRVSAVVGMIDPTTAE